MNGGRLRNGGINMSGRSGSLLGILVIISASAGSIISCERRNRRLEVTAYPLAYRHYHRDVASYNSVLTTRLTPTRITTARYGTTTTTVVHMVGDGLRTFIALLVRTAHPLSLVDGNTLQWTFCGTGCPFAGRR